MDHRSIARALTLVLGLLAVAGGGCSRPAFELAHQRAGGAEVGVLIVAETRSAWLPGVRVTPPPEKKFVRVALHARGSGKLEDSDVFLVGQAGTRAEASRGWGDTRLDSTFRVLDYWFELPAAETPASLEVKGDKVPVAIGKDVWPWRYQVGKLQVVEDLLVSGAKGDQHLKPGSDEALLVLEVTFESLLESPAALPKADGGERGPLRIFVETPAPDTTVPVRFLRLVGEGVDAGIGAVAAAGSGPFYASSDMQSTSFGSAEPKIACRLSSRISKKELAKLKELSFGPLRVAIPPA